MKIAAVVLVALALITIAVWSAWTAHANRFDRLAASDLRKFQKSGKSHLYAHYPQIITLVAGDASLAPRVTKLHLSGCDFRSSEIGGHNFSAISKLPNLTEIECAYAHGVDLIVPAINASSSLHTLSVYYGGPVESLIDQCNSASLRTLQIHSYSDLEIAAQSIEDFTKRMPECNLFFSTDRDHVAEPSGAAER